MLETIWISLFDKQFTCSVTRINQQGGNLRIVENTTNNELLNQDVGLLNGAETGPDMEDVAKWHEICRAVIDNYQKNT